MQNYDEKTAGASPDNAARRQLVACAIALGIMGLGAWMLLGMEAPYHPEGEVTRYGSILTSLSDGN